MPQLLVSAETIASLGWPEGTQLPTLQEAEDTVQMIEAIATQLLDELASKFEIASPEMLDTPITI